MPENEKDVNILLVDDEPKNLMALEAVLEGLGHQLVRAKSGEEALRQLMQKDFAVILLDVLMPGLNGFETAALIRQRDRSRYTPIIFLTAMGKTDEEIFQGYAVGAIDYLVKPFVPAVLRSKVAVLVDLYVKTEQVRRLNEEMERRAKELEGVNLMLGNENEMRKKSEEDLRHSEAELKALNATLEARVEERTAAVEERSRQLTVAVEELQQFVYASSHDLQEPLRTMGNYLQFLEYTSRDQLSPEMQEMIRNALRCSQRMRELINGLLDYARVTAKQPRFRKVDLNEVVQEVLEQMDASISAKKAHLERMSLPTIEGEKVLLGLLFQNLIGNALKFSRERVPEIQIGVEEKAGEWVFWVKDNGIGIEPKYFDQIFRIFKRLHTRDEFSGAGLGLAVCKKTVELHGGRLWCESEPGQGSCFYFSIPFSIPAAETQAPAAVGARTEKA
jgi:two-component system sensor histidine kinase/response regulator